MKILLVGCGQLGGRHLQAVASLPEVRRVEVVDPRPEALALGRRRLKELPGLSGEISFRWLRDLGEASPGGDLCIVATQAQGRCRQVQEADDRLGYRSFLIEKIVAQSVAEMEELLESARRRRLSIWVNLKTRAYPVHRRIKGLLAGEGPLVMEVTAGNLGLANNGVHTADLFAFYDGADRIESAGSQVDPILHPSKRGAELFDLSGTLQGRTGKGSRFILAYAAEHDGPELIALTGPNRRFLVDHLSRWAMESDRESGWSWRPLPFEGDLLVSEMSKGFVSEILSSGRCLLPTLEESMAAHRFILEELKPYFERLLKRELDLCPVT
ncbi:MAG: hypothetical protein HYZ90_00755 [Candidatus Omnitrophica bacterium]|nr:hypothetical protein [Candidatus Omnitrophota bacterium]